MAKFCTQCGSRLQEGRTCTCGENEEYITFYNDEQTKKEQNHNSIAINKIEIRKFFIDMTELFKSFVKSPSSAIKAGALNIDYKAGLFFFIIQSILTGIAVMLLIKQDVILGIVANPGLGSLQGASNTHIFLKTLMIMIIQFTFLAGIIFVIGKIFKGEESFKGLIAVLGIASIPVSMSILASILISFIYPALIMFLLLFGVLMSILVGMSGIAEVMKIDENNITYLVAISYVIYYSIILLLVKNSIK